MYLLLILNCKIPMMCIVVLELENLLNLSLTEMDLWLSGARALSLLIETLQSYEFIFSFKSYFRYISTKKSPHANCDFYNYSLYNTLDMVKFCHY